MNNKLAEAIIALLSTILIVAIVVQVANASQASGEFSVGNVSSLESVTVTAEVVSPYQPESTPQAPQQSMTIEHQRDLLNVELVN